VAHLELAMRIPMEFLPDPRTVIEDAHDREKEERDAADRRKREQEEKLVREAQRLVRQEEKKRARETTTPSSTRPLEGPPDSPKNQVQKRQKDNKISGRRSHRMLMRSRRAHRRCTQLARLEDITAQLMTMTWTRVMTMTVSMRLPT
jgi:hypothetical protein